ncbi:Uncharacterized protein TCM_018777 [Theobroma cacao]|uniref:Uncharacterized protein n=1 Tax=Theobroma cacao TaxID=3641 RepID=A0A061EFE5_THECC|nr:Uncharacterized protein TCM_018777 [Theobroma cacao]
MPIETPQGSCINFRTSLMSNSYQISKFKGLQIICKSEHNILFSSSQGHFRHFIFFLKISKLAKNVVGNKLDLKSTLSLSKTYIHLVLKSYYLTLMLKSYTEFIKKIVNLFLLLTFN